MRCLEESSFLARRLGVPNRKIVLSGVAKRDDEIDLAIDEDILAVQTESTRAPARASMPGSNGVSRARPFYFKPVRQRN
jgi:hypothetical protein